MWPEEMPAPAEADLTTQRIPDPLETMPTMPQAYPVTSSPRSTFKAGDRVRSKNDPSFVGTVVTVDKDGDPQIKFDFDQSEKLMYARDYEVIQDSCGGSLQTQVAAPKAAYTQIEVINVGDRVLAEYKNQWYPAVVKFGIDNPMHPGIYLVQCDGDRENELTPVKNLKLVEAAAPVQPVQDQIIQQLQAKLSETTRKLAEAEAGQHEATQAASSPMQACLAPASSSRPTSTTGSLLDSGHPNHKAGPPNSAMETYALVQARREREKVAQATQAAQAVYSVPTVPLNQVYEPAQVVYEQVPAPVGYEPAAATIASSGYTPATSSTAQAPMVYEQAPAPVVYEQVTYTAPPAVAYEQVPAPLVYEQAPSMSFSSSYTPPLSSTSQVTTRPAPQMQLIGSSPFTSVMPPAVETVVPTTLPAVTVPTMFQAARVGTEADAFAPGQLVDYYSTTYHKWLPATVLQVADGAYRLDIKEGGTVRADKLRPRQFDAKQNQATVSARQVSDPLLGTRAAMSGIQISDPLLGTRAAMGSSSFGVVELQPVTIMPPMPPAMPQAPKLEIPGVNYIQPTTTVAAPSAAPVVPVRAPTNSGPSMIDGAKPVYFGGSYLDNFGKRRVLTQNGCIGDCDAGWSFTVDGEIAKISVNGITGRFRAPGIIDWSNGITYTDEAQSGKGATAAPITSTPASQMVGLTAAPAPLTPASSFSLGSAIVGLAPSTFAPAAPALAIPSPMVDTLLPPPPASFVAPPATMLPITMRPTVF